MQEAVFRLPGSLGERTVSHSPIRIQGRDLMVKSMDVKIKPEEIITAVKKMKKRERDIFLEDLLAVMAPEYLESIKEARDDYDAGRIQTHEEVFGH